MTHILELSKISKDLLQDDEDKHIERKQLHKMFESREKNSKAKVMQAPEVVIRQLEHPLLINKPTLKEFVEMRRRVGGNAQAEQFIKFVIIFFNYILRCENKLLLY